MARLARTYVECDCARYDDYYLTEGDGIAMRFVAAVSPNGEISVEQKQSMAAAAGLMQQAAGSGQLAKKYRG